MKRLQIQKVFKSNCTSKEFQINTEFKWLWKMHLSFLRPACCIWGSGLAEFERPGLAELANLTVHNTNVVAVIIWWNYSLNKTCLALLCNNHFYHLPMSCNPIVLSKCIKWYFSILYIRWRKKKQKLCC